MVIHQGKCSRGKAGNDLKIREKMNLHTGIVSYEVKNDRYGVYILLVLNKGID